MHCALPISVSKRSSLKNPPTYDIILETWLAHMYAYNYLFISIFWQKEVESRALKECKNMIFIIITIAESERWLSSSFCNDSFDCKSVFFLHSIQSICLRFLFWMCWCKNIFRIQLDKIIRFCKSRILSLSIIMNETWCDDLTVSYFKSNKH